MPSERNSAASSAPSIRPATANIKDSGKVELGGISPSLTPVRVTPLTVADTGRVKLGGIAPAI
jgi:hypothetical protein